MEISEKDLQEKIETIMRFEDRTESEARRIALYRLEQTENERLEREHRIAISRSRQESIQADRAKDAPTQEELNARNKTRSDAEQQRTADYWAAQRQAEAKRGLEMQLNHGAVAALTAAQIAQNEAIIKQRESAPKTGSCPVCREQVEVDAEGRLPESHTITRSDQWGNSSTVECRPYGYEQPFVTFRKR